MTDDASTDALYARIRAAYPTLTNEQCVELVRKVAGIKEGVWDWRRGTSVRDRLPAGTPIATFMDRRGEPSEFYDAHQGVGAPGNNTTHAAVLIDYTRDGIVVAEQYQGSGGPHLHEYKFDDPRGGEKAAENYYAINDASGRPAGAANPLRGPRPPASAEEAYGYGIGAEAAKPVAPTPHPGPLPPGERGFHGSRLLARRATIGRGLGLRPSRGGFASSRDEVAGGGAEKSELSGDFGQDTPLSNGLTMAPGDPSPRPSPAGGEGGLALKYRSRLQVAVG